MFPFFLKKTRFKALFAGLVLLLLTGLTISTALIFTGCPPGDSGTQTVTYTVTKGTITGQGDITADKENAAEGETVTLTIDPATGWELQSVAVTAAVGTNLDVSGTGSIRTFTMPASDVTFNGVFKQQDENIAITLVDPDALSDDITLVPVADASQVTFTVSGNYHDYQWYLDGDKLNETSGSLTLYKSVVGTDPRHIIVIALDTGDTPYSGAVLFQFN